MARKRGLDHSVVETKQSKEQDEAIALLGKSWVEFCGLTCPIDSWLLGLARAHGLDASEYAIRQTGRKLYSASQNGDPMDADGARRYCASVARNATSGAFPDRAAPAARQEK